MAYIPTQIISADPGWVTVEHELRTHGVREVVRAVVGWALMRDMGAQNEPNKIGPITKVGMVISNLSPETAETKDVEVVFDEERYERALAAGGEFFGPTR